MERRDEQSIEAVKLYYQHGLSQAEVATRMGLSRPRSPNSSLTAVSEAS